LLDDNLSLRFLLAVELGWIAVVTVTLHTQLDDEQPTLSPLLCCGLWLRVGWGDDADGYG